MSEPDPILTSGEAPAEPRFVLVDALRGIAAMAVLFHHLLFNSALQKTLWLALPAWFCAFCHYGAFGVEIFFVLSGFVIAHSLRNVNPSFKSVGNFMLRRQLRLDPPYWTMMLITIALNAIEMHIPWIEKRPMPNFGETILNFFYLQNITGSLPVLGVAWTLCLEVQFYLVFILLLLAGKYFSSAKVKAADISASLVALLGVGSLLMPRDVFSPWFLNWWFYFAAGALCYWAVRDPKRYFTIIGFLVLFLIAAVTEDPIRMLTGWVTVVLLYTAGRLGTLTRWLNYPVLQYLGRISYSIYLVHLVVAIYVLRLGFRLTQENHAAAVMWFVLAGLASIASAQVLNMTVERLGIRLAARFKLPPEKNPSIPSGPLLEECVPLPAR